MENELKTFRLQMVIAPSQVAKIDAWRKAQDGLPSRSEAVRSLVDVGLSAPVLSTEVAAALAAASAQAKKPESFILDMVLSKWLRERGLLPKDTQAVDPLTGTGLRDEGGQ